MMGDTKALYLQVSDHQFDNMFITPTRGPDGLPCCQVPQGLIKGSFIEARWLEVGY